MFTSTDFSNAITSARQQLQVVDNALSSIVCPQVSELRINLSALSHDSICELLDDVPSGYRKSDQDTDYVYIIRQVQTDDSLIRSMWAQLDGARKFADDYCRVNRDLTNPTALYVGRSKKLKSRLTQHLGTEQKGVYSMHLQRWATVNTAEISISYMRFENQEDLLVQAVEDGIWAALKPAFGRKGEK